MFVKFDVSVGYALCVLVGYFRHYIARPVHEAVLYQPLAYEFLGKLFLWLALFVFLNKHFYITHIIYMLIKPFFVFIPPFNLKKFLYFFIGKSHLNLFCRNTTINCIWFNIFCNYSTCCYNSTISNMNF